MSGTVFGFQENQNVCVLDCVDSQVWLETKLQWRSFSKTKKRYILDNYLFIFALEEGIEPHFTLRLMEFLVRYGCRVHSQAFISQSLKIYFDKKYPNHKFTTSNLHDNFHIGVRGGLASNGLTFNYKKSFNTDRKYLLRYFSFRHTPARDDAWLFLRDMGYLDDKSKHCFVRRKRDVPGHKDSYSFYEKYNNLRIPFDRDWLDTNYFIHESELNREITQNNTQDDGLYECHLDSYFDILTETIHPLENHHYEIVQNQTSFSKRCFFPLICRNVFHIYPTNKPLEKVLKSYGIELFFDSHEDFLKNATIEFYKREDVQKKLTNNQTQIMKELFRNWWL